ncbi:hypothetical protein BCR43DRAFT_487323 [Syncephalastrum racemosum]|uniref:Uncharacterized protein n=1 Tax=Syncephalastrum racemosum TaxID=13706 RepID=A0A1X2HQR3_SYNRA|nr:hypothetical protein BCR43DRAFT_487323 [Syncephalastrum racemosum]
MSASEERTECKRRREGKKRKEILPERKCCSLSRTAGDTDMMVPMVLNISRTCCVSDPDLTRTVKAVPCARLMMDVATFAYVHIEPNNLVTDPSREK